MTAELLCGPSNDIAKGRRHLLGLDPVHLRQHGAISIPHDETHGKVDGEQAVQRLTRHRTGKHISAHHYLIDAIRLDFFEHRVERRQIAVDVVDRRESHHREDLARSAWAIRGAAES